MKERFRIFILQQYLLILIILNINLSFFVSPNKNVLSNSSLVLRSIKTWSNSNMEISDFRFPKGLYVSNIVVIPIFVNLNITRYISCTLSVNLNALIINNAKLVIQLT